MPIPVQPPDPAPVLLRPLQDSDSNALFRWINDRATVVFNAPFRPVDWDEHLRWMAAIRTDPTLRIFGIVERATQRLVGSCQLLNISRLHHSAELQIRIGETDARDRGLGSHAVRALLDIGWRDLGLHRIALTARADNTRAIRAYEKCGFVQEGRLRDAALIEGRYVDLIAMAVLAP
jgi:RimJ/RimL family protein N-acetyltransferase